MSVGEGDLVLQHLLEQLVAFHLSIRDCDVVVHAGIIAALSSG